MKKIVLHTFMLIAWILLLACSPTDPKVVTSVNQNSRVNILVMHHTSENFGRSLEILTEHSDRPVSAHYLIPEPLDASYPNKQLEVYQLVSEDRRAWHAGISSWAKKNLLNDQSIGIEIVNQTYCHPALEPITEDELIHPESICFYPDYPETQISMVIALAQEILLRHPDIKPTNIVGHADIAPARKIDPGPNFPWQRLYKLGIGAWYDDETVIKYWEVFRQDFPSTSKIQRAFKIYGYGIEITGEQDQQTLEVARAFQLHFLQSVVNGQLSVNTIAILFALVEKYFPEELAQLQNVEESEIESR